MFILDVAQNKTFECSSLRSSSVAGDRPHVWLHFRANDKAKAEDKTLALYDTGAQVNVMSKQLEDLLELSRIGRAVNPPTLFSISDIADEVVQMMRGLIDECDASVQIDGDMPEVYADQARIREVLKNLVENGIKFARKSGKPRVRINASKRDDRVLCRVEDNGPGIEPRYQDKVFGLFDRLETGIPGTGVGLALVKRIIEIHDGNIWIESQGDGQGCCFCFTLPVQRGI